VQSFDAIILAGGSARRLGGADKPLVEVAGRALIDYAVDAVRSAGVVVVVGPRRPSVAGVQWCREDPPGGGPVAALAAGLIYVTADVVVVLAADLPSVGPAVPVLLSRRGPADAALLVADGRRNHLAAAWRVSSLRARLARLGPLGGASMRSLVEGASLVEVDDEHGWSNDCDTWDDVERARGQQR
jgi:molybdopterin-guanine dinucleotide biosynthesis protein A